MKKEQDPIEKAVSLFEKGFTCSQSVLAPFASQFGLDEKTALKLACGLGGGMGRQGLTCGAVTGAYLVLGLKYGSVSPEQKDAKEKTYQLVREFADKFKALHKSTECQELLGYNLGDPDDAKIIKERNLTATICPVMVRDAATILQELLNK
ncbi:MAG TPA: C-GCAxxG-C-C family protein [bacterium]|nr:C-GCAxxG-C-C family protein [bacterium]HPN42320.1 C-GCAxxG-C-C family protein [bacterium]